MEELEQKKVVKLSYTDHEGNIVSWFTSIEMYEEMNNTKIEDLNKYYTPSIEEFHVGFEYEHYSSKWSYLVEHLEDNKYRLLEDPECKKDWYREVYDFYDFIYIEDEDIIESLLSEYLSSGKIRVKYLDKKDIEELGWTYEKTQPGLNELQFTLNAEREIDDLCLDYDLDDKWLRISMYGDGDVTRFSGYIKNKSELKRLMKWLRMSD